MKKQVLIVACWGISALLTLTALVSARAQEATPFPPEATVVPEGAVFTAPGRCTVSPDESLIAVRDYGVFDLSSGEKRFDFIGNVAEFSPDGRYFLVNGVGLYDTNTGELLIESPVNYRLSYDNFTADGRYFIDYDNVYDLVTLEKIADLDREGDGFNSFSAGGFMNDGQWFVYQKTYGDKAPPDSARISYMNARTWEPVIDTSIYPFGAGITFSPDFRRYAVGGFGLMSYHTGEKLFDLPVGIPHFNSDSSMILMTTSHLYPRPTDVSLVFLDGETGEHINQFNLSWEAYTTLMGFQVLTSPDMSKIAMPDVIETGATGSNNIMLQGWRLIDVRTNTLIKRWLDTSVISAYEALGLPIPTQQYVIHGRYVVEGEGVFDAATNALLYPLTGAAPYLTHGGSYVVSQNPCTVWSLP